MIHPFRNLFYWALDYLYVFRTNLEAFFRRESPDKYRQPGGYPVIVIPGIYEKWIFMRPIIKVLYDEGYDVHAIRELGYNRDTVEHAATHIEEYVLKNNLTSVAVVSHSKGGLIGKYLLASSKITVEKLVALNAPYSGSRYAYLFPFGPLSIFAPHSKILTILRSDSKHNSKVISIFGRFDPHIPGGSSLEGATNIQLDTFGHFRILADTTVQNAVIVALKSVDVRER